MPARLQSVNHRLRGSALRVGLALLVGIHRVQAGEPAAAPENAAVGRPPVWVWYRSSEGCPDGASFIARLANLGQPAQLASVGDRVDFVVTLGALEDVSSGRLERQTLSGTVAMREYRDARCDQVAEALALTLDLALDPAASSSTSTSTSTPTSTSMSSVADVTPVPTSASVPARSTTWQWGAQGLLQSGVAPQLAFGGAVFGAVEDAGWFVRQLRVALFVLHAEGRAQARELSVSVLGARLEGCPLSVRLPGVGLYPCAGIDVGALLAAGPSSAFGTSDAGAWAAALAHGRAVFELGSALAVEAQLGATLPLVKYELGPVQDTAAWFRTRSIGLEAGLGIAWRIP